MKKNKLTFLIAATFLALSSLVGCESAAPTGQSSNNAASNDQGSEVIGGSSADSGTSQGGGDTSQGGGNNSQGGGNTSQGGGNTSQGGGQDVKTDWSDGEKVAMRQALHGLVLPFVNMSVSVTLSQSSNTLRIESSDLMADGFLASYAAKYTSDSTWEGGDISMEYGVTNGNAYAFRKKVSENGKNYYVAVMFTGIIQNPGDKEPSISRDGRFYLEATDPYEYAFPTQFIGQWLGQVFNTTIVPPAFDAEYYSLQEEGVLVGYSERNIENEYKATVERSGNFTIDNEKNADGYYVCHSNDGKYNMLFKYDTTQKVMILMVEAPKGWNAAAINAVFTKHNATPFDLPVISNPNITFQVSDQESGGVDWVTIYAGKVTVQMAQDYVAALKTMGYKVTGSIDPNESYNYVMANVFTDGGMYSLTISYSKDVNQLNPYEFSIFFSLAPNVNVVKSWPATSIARYIEADKDSVPAFDSKLCYGYTFSYNQGSYCHIVIHVDEGTESQAKDSYVAILTAAGYIADGTDSGQPRFKSANSEIHISIACQPNQFPGQIELKIQEMEIVATPWPAESILTAINGIVLLDPITDTIPALDVSEARSCYINSNYSYEFEIVIEGLANSEADFIREFKANGWTEDPYYGYDTTTSSYGVLISPNKQMVALFDVYQNDLSIYVKCYFDQYYWEWPSTELNAILAKWGVTRDTLPAFNTANMVFFTESTSEQKVEIEIAVGEPLYQTALTDYCVALERIGYHYDANLGGHISDNHELLVQASIETNGIKLVVSNVSLVYKVVGFNGTNWAFADGLLMSDATNPEENYRLQYSASFHVEAGAKFKVVDSINNWYGNEIADYRPGGVFGTDTDKNITVNAAGTVTVYFKIYDDDSKAMWLEFVEDQVTPPAVDWPNDDINATLREWKVKDEIPVLNNEAITAVTFETINEKSFCLTVVGAGSLIDDYEDLLDENYDYDDVSESWLPTSDLIAIKVHVDASNLIIVVSKKEEAPVDEPAFKVVGLGNEWDYDNGLDLNELDAEEGYLAQYSVTFDVEKDEEFKLTNGTVWVGFDKLDTNDKFNSGENNNIVAKEDGSVELKFNILSDGEYEIVIDFTPDEEPQPEAMYKIVGLGNNWSYEDGVELEKNEEPGEGVASQYAILFHVDRGEEFKVTDGTLWYGTDELAANDKFASGENNNIVAKESGDVGLVFTILENGDKQISIVFTADEEQPTEATYTIYYDGSWDDMTNGDPVFYAWVWGGSYGEGQWIELGVDEENHCFYLENIDLTAEHFIVVAMNPECLEDGNEVGWTYKLHQTNDLDFPAYALRVRFRNFKD